MKTILITGAFGFIGLKLLNEFKNSGHKIFTFSKSKKNTFNHFSGDILNNETVDKVLSKIKPKILIHLAWETTPNKFYEDKINLQWSKSTIQLIKKFYLNGGEKFIFSSTCDEYGIKSESSNIDETYFCKPRSRYGKSKNQVSNFLIKNFEYKCIILRNFFVCGPGENKKKLLSYIIKNVIKGKKIYLKRPNDMIDFIDVRDVANIIYQFAIDDNFGIYNIGSSIVSNPKNLAQKIMQIKDMSKSSDLIHCNIHKDIIRIISNNSKLKTTLKYEIKYSIERTIYDLMRSLDV